MNLKMITSTFLIFIFCVHLAESLRCYENGCYEAGKHCSYPGKIGIEKPCPPAKKGLHLSCVALRSEGKGGSATLRGCSSTEEPPKMGCDKKGEVTSCRCPGELCNKDFPDGK